MSMVLGLGLNILKRDIVAAISGAVYGFDGSTMYAIMGTAWVPGGLPYTISGKFRPEETTTGAIISSTGDGLASGILVSSPTPTTQYAYQNNPPPGSSFLTNSEETANGETGSFEFTMAASGGSGFINGVAVIPDTQLPLSSTISGISHIATVADFLTLFEFGGAIWDLRFTDNSPLQNRTVCVGDRVRHVVLNNPFTITGNDTNSYTVSLDWKRANQVPVTENGVTKAFGNSTGTTALTLFDTLHPTAHRVSMQTEGNNVTFVTPTDPLVGVAIGQTCHIEVTKVGTLFTLLVDGAVIATQVAVGTGDLIVERLCKGDFNQMGIGAVFGNFSFTNDDGDTWFYALENES